jgi:hypothetical protein
MAMFIDNDKQLWKAADYKREFGVDNKQDFYDQYLTKKVWPETFAKSYNQEIDEHQTSFKILTTPMTKDQINPDHYQGIVAQYQYIECMEFILGTQGLKKHLLGQIYKYLMRMGKKDNELQEVRKVVWYTRCLEILEREGTIIGFLHELK